MEVLVKRILGHRKMFLGRIEKYVLWLLIVKEMHFMQFIHTQIKSFNECFCRATFQQYSAKKNILGLDPRPSA